MKSYSLPNDLIFEILSRLPAKSAARFHCVSKPWASMLSLPCFTRSWPRLLFAIAEDEDSAWCFFSLPHVLKTYEKSSSTLVAAAEFHAKFSPGNMFIIPDRDRRYFTCGYASGLIYLHGCRYQARPLICNPNTGRYVILPSRYTYRKAYSFFGFDPIDKQCKVLSIRYYCGPGHDKILTLEDGDLKWRKIKVALRHDVKSDGICINGVLYYVADTSNCFQKVGYEATSDYVIVCFDVRSEKFTFIDIESLCELINYKGKLAMIFWENDVASEDDEDDVDDAAINELRVWVLEDVKKQQWLKYSYALSDDKFSRRHVSIAGMTVVSGEIVFSMRKYTSKQPFYVFFFDPERNNLRRVEIQGFGEAFKNNTCSVWTFVDHVENLNVNDLKPLKSVDAPFVEAIQDYDYSATDSD